jgi:hypothetical protein
MSRDTSPRQQVEEHDVDEFDYPFTSCCLEEGELGDCPVEIRHIPHRVSRPIGNFPHNIKRWIWSRPGQNDGDAWVCIVELKPDETYDGVRYAYFRAWCDYTGFDCEGGAYSIVTSKVEDLIEYALENSDYVEYLRTTVACETW